MASADRSIAVTTGGRDVTDWWSEGQTGINEGLRMYSAQTRPGLERDFEELCARLDLRVPARLDKEDMRVVAAFKGRGAYLAVQDPRVPDITERGIGLAVAGDIEGGIRELCNLRGVSVPVASTILTAANPREFGVIDRLTMGEVVRLLVVRSEAGLSPDASLADLGWAAWRWVRDPIEGWPVAYARYVSGLRRRSAELSVTARVVEKVLFAYGRATRSEGG